MSAATDKAKLTRIMTSAGACEDARAWAKGKTPAEAWDSCERPVLEIPRSGHADATTATHRAATGNHVQRPGLGRSTCKGAQVASRRGRQAVNPWRSCKHSRERKRRGICAQCGITNWSRWRRWVEYARLLRPPLLVATWDEIALGLQRTPTRVISALCYRVRAARTQAYDEGVAAGNREGGDQ